MLCFGSDAAAVVIWMELSEHITKTQTCSPHLSPARASSSWSDPVWSTCTWAEGSHARCGRSEWPGDPTPHHRGRSSTEKRASLKKTKNTTTGRRSQFVRQLYVLGVNRSAFLRGRVTGFEVWGLDMFMFTGSLKYVTRLYGMYCVVRTFHRPANHCQFCNSIITSMFLEFCNRASHNEARVQQLHLVAINKMLPHLFITWLLIMQAGFMWCFIPQI